MILLSICIPTFNRLPYLKELLPRIIDQIRNNNLPVELIISNNCSTDETYSYLNSLLCFENIKVIHKPLNVGPDQNFLDCIKISSGKYVWLFGDDDLLEDDGIFSVCQILSSQEPTLLILRNNSIKFLSVYDDYKECIECERLYDHNFILNHTLITSNIFKRTIFDHRYATSKLWTSYSHMFGIMKNLVGKICSIGQVFETRTVRADFHKWPFPLCLKQAFYLWWISRKFSTNLHWQYIRLVVALPVEILYIIKRKVCNDINSKRCYRTFTKTSP